MGRLVTLDGWLGDGGWIGQGVFQLIVAPTVPLRDEIVGLFTSAAASTDQHEQQQGGGKYHHRHTAITGVAACLVGVGWWWLTWAWWYVVVCVWSRGGGDGPHVGEEGPAGGHRAGQRLPLR